MALPGGLVLPVSVAMKHHEERYLLALQTFSRPVRDLWQVTAIDEVRMDAVFSGVVSINLLGQPAQWQGCKKFCTLMIVGTLVTESGVLDTGSANYLRRKLPGG